MAASPNRRRHWPLASGFLGTAGPPARPSAPLPLPPLPSEYPESPATLPSAPTPRALARPLPVAIGHRCRSSQSHWSARTSITAPLSPPHSPRASRPFPYTFTNQELGTSGCLHTPPSRGREQDGGGPRAEVAQLGPGGRKSLASCGHCSLIDPCESGEAPCNCALGSRPPRGGAGPGVAGRGRPISARRGPGRRDFRSRGGWRRRGNARGGSGSGRGRGEPPTGLGAPSLRRAVAKTQRSRASAAPWTEGCTGSAPRGSRQETRGPRLRAGRAAWASGRGSLRGGLQYEWAKKHEEPVNTCEDALHSAEYCLHHQMSSLACGPAPGEQPARRAAGQAGHFSWSAGWELLGQPGPCSPIGTREEKNADDGIAEPG